MRSVNLSEDALATELANRPGLIPTGIDVSRQRVLWIDWGSYHFYEGFFHDSQSVYERLRGSPPECFTSSLESLESSEILNPEISSTCIEPSGFIFHTGRCGSTLLAKALARSRRHLVFAEAEPHNRIWHALPADPDRAIRVYRNLLLLMGRRRLPSLAAHLIKFTSFNITRFHFIRSAFPRVPALFLFRDPAAVIASCLRKPPLWLGRDLGIGRIWASPEAAIKDYFNAALTIHEPRFQCLDYRDLVERGLPPILRLFQLDPPKDELRMMESELAWDAKSVLPRLFVPASRVPDYPGDEDLGHLYYRLKKHAPLPLETCFRCE